MLTVKQLAETVSYSTIIDLFASEFTKGNIPSHLKDEEISLWWPTERNRVAVILKSKILENETKQRDKNETKQRDENETKQRDEMPELKNIRITFDSFVLDLDMRKGGGLL